MLNQIICVKKQYLRLFTCEKRIALLVCEYINSNFSKSKITYKLFAYKFYTYDHSTVCKQMTDVKLSC